MNFIKAKNCLNKQKIRLKMNKKYQNKISNINSNK